MGQGDPQSTVLYQYYNAGLLEIPMHGGEDAVAYVDDAFMMAIEKDFPSAHRNLSDMIYREGVANWYKIHSSPLSLR